MAFHDAPGPATHARQALVPGEELSWAARGRRLSYDVAGVDGGGHPVAGSLAREGGVLCRATATMTVAATLYTDVASDPGPTPDVVVFGDSPGCLAYDTVSVLEPKGSPWRTWALTSDRLLVLEVEDDPPTPHLGGLLRRVIDVGRDLVDVVTDRTRRYGRNVEGVPVGLRPMAVVAEVDRAEVVEIAVSRRRFRMRTRPCLRLSFVDGSGLDLLLGVDDEAVFDWMVTLTRGAL